MRRPILRRFESLEPRLAPAGIVVFNDVDGDLVTVRSSEGTTEMLEAAVTRVPTGIPGRSQLTRVALDHPGFAGTRLKISAEANAAGGDGEVHVGEIVSAHDLGRVIVGGDLASIRVGDGDPLTPGLTELMTSSIGRFGTATGSSTTTSFVAGSLSSMRVEGDLAGARFMVGGGIGSAWIGGSLVGGEGDFSGTIRSDGAIGSITVDGSVIGGRGEHSGHVGGQRIGSIAVGRDLVGGGGHASGSVSAVGRIGSVGVESIVAGEGPLSGSVTGRLLGDITVRRDIRGTAQQPVWITGVGSRAPTGARAIDSLSVGGAMSRAMVLGGWRGTVPLNGNARIGAVTVEGTMRASNVVAGVRPTVVPLFGRHLDIPIDDQRGSRIDSLVVNGEVQGSGRGTEAFAVIAESIGTVRLAGRSFTATQRGISPAGDNFVLRLTYAASDLPPPRPGFSL